MWNYKVIKRAEWSEDLKALVKAFQYRRHSVALVDADSIELTGGYWDGGSKDVYHGFDANTGRLENVAYPTNPPQFGGGEPPRVNFADDGRYIVKTGVFCGKTACLTVYGSGAVARFKA